MYPGALPYTLSLLIITMLTGGIALYAFRRTWDASTNSFGWFMVAITEWVAAYAMETMAPTLAEKVFAEKLTYFGIAATPIFWLFFTLDYTGFGNRLSDGMKAILTGWTFAVLGVTLTNDYHQLMWKSASLDPNGLPGLIFEGYGPAFWIITVVCYAFVLSGIALWINAYLKSTLVFRQQIAIMIFGSIIPLAGNLIYLTDKFQARGLDLTPFTFSFSGILLALGFFRYDLLNLVPLAAPLVIRNLSDAVVVVDNFERIVSLNPAAEKWLNTGENAIGQNAHQVLGGMDAIWSHWDAPEHPFQIESGEIENRRWFQMLISSLLDQRGKNLGRVIVARDKTHEQTSLLSERRHTQKMELINSITRAALENTNFYEILQTLADQLGRVLEADGAYITLWNNASQMAIPAAAFGKLRETYPAIQFEPAESTLIEAILTQGHLLVLDDVLNSGYKNQCSALQFPSRSILALPLIANEIKLGVALIAFDKPHHFTPDEVDTGEQIGPQIALAIYKARLLEDSYQHIAQLALLDEVSKSVADSLDEQNIIQRTIDGVVNRFGYAEAAISLLVDRDNLEFAAISDTGNGGLPLKYRQKVGEGIIGRTAETRSVYVTGDIEHDPFYLSTGKRSGSAVGLPMLDEGQLLGVLYVESPQRNAFNHEDIQTLHTLVSHVATSIQKARLFTQVQEHLRANTALQSISQTVSSSLELETIFQTVIQLLKDTFDYTYLSIYLLDGAILRLGAQVGYPAEMIIYEIPVSSGVIGRTVVTQQTQFISDVNKDPDFLRASYEVESEICVPLLKEGAVLGVINIEAAPGRPLTENDVDLMTTLAGSVAIAIDNARLHAEVRSLAMTDAMTKLPNRRAFDLTLATEIARAERYGHPLGLIIFDLDNFKLYNDRWGHPAGDERLIEVAKLLQTNARSPDVAARYGGEEFALILPFTARNGALALAERIRKAAESQAGETGKIDGYIPGYTISVGVANFPENGRLASDLLYSADHAALAAKRQGKNRICVAGDIDEIINR